MTTHGNNQRVQDGSAGPQPATPWSVWGARLLAILSLGLAISLAWLWIEVFYRGVSANVQLSFKSFDNLYLPTGTTYSPIIGRHFFGDYQLQLGFANNLRHSISPYFDKTFPEQYPPLSQLLFLPLSLLSLQTSSTIYFFLAIAVFLVPLWLLLEPRSPEIGIIFLVPTAVLTTGFMISLDRGNDALIAVGLIAFAIWAWREERWIWCGVFLVAAISLKAYPAALLVVPLAFRRYKFTLLVAVSAVAVNVLALAFYAGGFLRNLRAVADVLVLKPPIAAVAPNQKLTSWSLYSVLPKTAGLLFGPSAVDGLLAARGLVTWLPAVFYVVGLFFVIRRGRVPQWCWGPLTLASTQLLVPVSFGYTTAWAALAAVWYAKGSIVDTAADDRAPEDDSAYVALRIMLLLALAGTLVPSVFTISGSGGFEIPLTMYASPVLIFLTLCVAIFHSSRPVRTAPVPATVG
jgi:hypothetical protein